jgi:hypothetical protein
METYYVFEEWIPAEIAISSKDFWYELPGYTEADYEEVKKMKEKLDRQSRTTRIIKVTREVIGNE